MRDLDGSDFFVFVAGVIPTQKVRSFTGSGLFWIRMGLCTLHSAGVRGERIKAADI